MSNTIEVNVPDIGDFKDVPIVEIAISAGSVVDVGDTLIVVESDKATIDIPSEFAGEIIELKVALGDLVSQNSAVLIMQKSEATEIASVSPTEDAVALDHTESAEQTTQAAPREQHFPKAPQSDVVSRNIYASPSVRRYARQLGAPIQSISGSGNKQRITRQDVEAYVKKALSSSTLGKESHGFALAEFPEWPRVDYAKFGLVERKPITRIAKISGPALARNAAFIPHVTNFDKADISELEVFRKASNADAGPNDSKLTLLAFTVMAVVSALKKYPAFNSSLDGKELVYKHYWNIGVAANTPDGLIVPVIRNADEKGLYDIAQDIASLAKSARDGNIKPADMQGATFTISSLGAIGGTNFTPIINAPEVAILGMTKAELQPVWDGSTFQPRLIQPLSLSWDHRAVDGVAAAYFLQHISKVLSDFKRILL